jgi:hypothetical protein
VCLIHSRAERHSNAEDISQQRRTGVHQAVSTKHDVAVTCLHTLHCAHGHIDIATAIAFIGNHARNVAGLGIYVMTGICSSFSLTSATVASSIATVFRSCLAGKPDLCRPKPCIFAVAPLTKLQVAGCGNFCGGAPGLFLGFPVAFCLL